MPDCLCPLKGAAQDAPRALALETLTFEELNAETEKCVLELQSMGLQAQDRIAVHIPPGLRFYTLLFASLRIGALFCPLNLSLPSGSIQSHLSLFSPKIYFTNAGSEVRPSLFHDLPPSSLLIFTSGSTGSPKIAVLPLSTMVSNATSAISTCNLCPGNGWLLSLPLHHVGGLAILFRCLLARATLLLEPSNQVTHLSYVPAQLYRSWPIYPRLSCLLLGGGPIREIPQQLPISVSYAMTETASLILGRNKPLLKKGFWHLGFPVSGKEIKLSEEGEILVRGDSLFYGYWDGQSVKKPFDKEGWFATKDLGLFDSEEGFAIVGRKDNQFISGGENIQPEEIERELLLFPGMIDVIVVPIEDPRFGFRPAACIRTIDGQLEKDAIQRFLSERLPKYKIPTTFFSLDEFSEIGLKIPRKQIFEFINMKFFK